MATEEENEQRRAVKEARQQKESVQRFDKYASDTLKEREDARKEGGHIRNQISENAKKQLDVFKGMMKPSSMIKAVGLASGSPLIAILGGQLGDLVATTKEAKEAAKSENRKLSDLLKEQGRGSAEIAEILEDTKRMSGENEDALFDKLALLGFKDKEVFDKFLAIKKEGDEKLIAANMDLIQGIKQSGVDEKEHGAKLRQLLDDNLRNPPERDIDGRILKAIENPNVDQLQEQRDDEKIRLSETQSEAIAKIADYMKDMSAGIKDMAKGLADKGSFGLGTIAGLIAAPIFLLIGFFEGLNTQLKWLDDFTKGKLTKMFAPLKSFLVGLKDLKIFKFLGKGVTALKNIFMPVVNFFKNIMKARAVMTGFSGPFKMIATFAKTFGNLLGKLVLPFQIIMGVYDAVTGFMEGFEEDGIIGGIKGAITGIIEGLIGGLIRMLADGTAWILNFLGFTKLAETLKSGVNGMLDGFYALIGNVVDLIGGILTFDPSRIKSGVLGLLGTLIEGLLKPVDMFIGLVTSIFSLAGIKLPEFSLADFLRKKVTEMFPLISKWLGISAPEEEGKIVNNARRSSAGPEVSSAIDNAVNETGISRSYMETTAAIESNNNPNARNPSGAKGLYQFMPETAEEYGIAGKEFDAKASALAAAKLAKNNAKQIEAAGFKASDENLYLAHQQGAKGAIDLLKASKSGAEMSPRAKRNMMANMPGSDSDTTADEFVQFWKSNYKKKQVGDPTLKSGRQGEVLTREVARQGQDKKVAPQAPAQTSNIATSINTNNNIVNSPDMSVSTPDTGFANAVMGA